MPLMSLKQFTLAANEIVDSLPPDLMKNLNGGIIVEPSVKDDGDYVLMGEYIEDPGLGSMVVLYYGSFRELLGNAPSRNGGRRSRIRLSTN